MVEITISKEALAALKKRKRTGENYSSVIKRISKKNNLDELLGIIN